MRGSSARRRAPLMRAGQARGGRRGVQAPALCTLRRAADSASGAPPRRSGRLSRQGGAPTTRPCRRRSRGMADRLTARAQAAPATANKKREKCGTAAAPMRCGVMQCASRVFRLHMPLRDAVWAAAAHAVIAGGAHVGHGDAVPPCRGSRVGRMTRALVEQASCLGWAPRRGMVGCARVLRTPSRPRRHGMWWRTAARSWDAMHTVAEPRST